MNKKTIIGYFIGPIGTGLLGLISLPIMTWFFPVEEIGKISMLQVVSSLFILIFCFGLDQAYVREYYEEKNKVLLFIMTFCPGFILGGIVLILICWLNPTVISLWLYDEKNNSLSLLTIIIFSIGLILRFFSLIIRMQERSLAFSMIQIIPKLFFILFIFIIVGLDFVRNIYSLVAVHLLSMLVACVVCAWNIKSEIFKIFNNEWNWNNERFQKLLMFGLPLIIGGLAGWILNTIDKIFLRIFSSFEELGLYSITFSIASVVTIFSGVFNTIWSPLVFKWINQGNINIEKIDKISEYLLIAIFFIVVLAGLFSWILKYILPIEYSKAQYLILPCLLSPLFYTLSETTAVGITIVKKTRFSMIASLGAMLCGLLLNFLLVPTYGATGASISTAISFWLFYILRTEMSKLVWIKIDRRKTYIVITLLTIMSIIHASIQSLFHIFIFWFLLLFWGIFLFKETLMPLVKKIRILVIY